MLRYEVIFVAGCQVLAPVVELPQARAMKRNQGVGDRRQVPNEPRRIWLETLPFDDSKIVGDAEGPPQ